MNTSDSFLRFAAECKVMAKFSRTTENRAVWSGLAQRWARCAELVDQQESNGRSRSSLKHHLKAAHTVEHANQVQPGALGNF
jgi:hypothetical protein